MECSRRAIGRVLAGLFIIKYGWYLRRKGPGPDGAGCVVVGLLYWAATTVAGFQLAHASSSPRTHMSAAAHRPR